MEKMLLKIENIYYDYKENNDLLPVLAEINISVKRGEFICIIGPSGCGKSTLFNILVGLEKPDKGRIFLKGEDITGTRGHIAYMPQRDLLFPWRTVMENVLLGVEIKKENLQKAYQEAEKLIPLFGLKGFENHYPDQLSGGMRQRAALLRTVLTHNDILALDEPFGALDALTRTTMQEWILSIQEKLDKTILFITHDIEEAILLADRIIILNGRPGRITDKLKIDLQPPRCRTDKVFVDYREKLLERLSAEDDFNKNTETSRRE
ncbi:MULTISPECIES: ABC transporter ATP-binding protein [unclassified Halanaerobium]|uniref:ABC transporter ATP-binding protein n=1 Tax=unclassified Halanaerobium TaxID=2641197 RepID=UPI000DF1EE0C|nr:MULTISPECIES: ABC transporter ATP-binding protein [unclassified Halanaerobium]RCW49238.1 ABC-type nitrate/sulfonate/bicarbonate transport system ATPase subunit [Halanaerobium sp. MA284_MarDTE_T2]RCW82932.1 ABC-type nitrate/sulfonate/bicarbonate transport system ATPase subunit [Halanaerobium sp. DL-01]